MTTPPTTAFRIHALSDETLAAVRARGTDATGVRAEYLVAAGGEPLRCCLRNAGPGERLLLFNHQPPLPAGPYRETGAVFAHAEPCAGLADDTSYPPAWRGRPQVLRGYDARGWIRTATTHDGSDPEAVIADLFAEPDVVEIHSRNIAWGCYMFTLTRR